MRLSFVIPAYNEEAALAGTLVSVLREVETVGACLPDASVEVIVVNNASIDKTKEIAASFSRVRVVDEPRKGIVRARAAGFAASSGELVAYIDADTKLANGWLQTVVKEFDADPRLVALSGPCIFENISFTESAMVKLLYLGGYLVSFVNYHVFGRGTMLQGANFVIRRNAWVQVGGFDTSIEFYGDDTDIARRISKVGKVKWTFALPVYTSARRMHEEGFARVWVRYALNHFSVLLSGKPYTISYTDVRSDTARKRPDAAQAAENAAQ